jgi:LysM repeat protein
MDVALLAADTPEVTPEAAPTKEATPQPSASSNTVQSALVGSASSSACTPRTDWPVYTVVAGDTLAKIARITTSTVAALASANCLADANRI